MKYGFGIDLGGTTVKIAYFDETGKMLEKFLISVGIPFSAAIPSGSPDTKKFPRNLFDQMHVDFQ